MTIREPFGRSLASISAAQTFRAARAATEQALLPDQLPRDAERVAVVALDPPVDEPAVEHVGDEVVADALDLRAVETDLAGAREDRALLRVDDDEAARDLPP
ncbi:MAG: hypothetical protein R3B82_25995 [Sandaracinaceae bacterium]